VDRSVNDNFKFNQETEFIPILGLIASQLNGTPEDSDKSNADEAVKAIASSVQQNHHPALLSILADELSVTSAEIHDFELFVPVIVIAL
jgi:aspartyl aminopeptidase